MSKKTVYTIFVAKFVFSLGMIFWTIQMTLGAGVENDSDNAFISYYHEVDKNYNKIVLANEEFNKQYRVELKFNNFILNTIDFQDVYFSQRVIEKRKDKKNILKIGENSLRFLVYDRNTSKLMNGEVKIFFTMPSSNILDYEQVMSLNTNYTVTISKKTYWNIMGIVSVGNSVGHFYIKTNAQ